MAIWHRGDRTETVTHRPWRIVPFAVGVAAAAIGIWALIRTGFAVDHPFNPATVVLGLHHTPTLAVGEIAAGGVLVLLGTSVFFGRAVSSVIGTASVLFGLLILVHQWDGRLRHWTAVTSGNAWVYVAAGAAALVAAMVLPTVRTQRVVEERDTPRDHWWHRHHAAA